METTSTGTTNQSLPVNWKTSDDATAGDPFGLTGKLVDGRYLVESVVGTGGFGVVYRVQHLRLDSPVALKVLRIPNRLNECKRGEFVRQFLQEGKLLFRLGSIHPTIVRVFEAGLLTANDGSLSPYLAMDWLDGIPLDMQLRRMRELGVRQMKLTEALTLLHPIVDCLATAHALGVAHLDVKPGNIFLLDRGHQVSPRLLDFGLAKIVGCNTSTPNWSDSVVGAGSAMTPAYAAPEQWSYCLGPTGPWTDVHALALVCLELLTGTRAFKGPSRSQLRAECLTESYRPTPRSLGLSVPAAVEKVFERALGVDPKQRYPDAREFWRALCRAGRFSTASTLSIPRSSFPSLQEQGEQSAKPVWLDATILSQSVAGSGGHIESSTSLLDALGFDSEHVRPALLRWRAALLVAGACLLIVLVVRSRLGTGGHAQEPLVRIDKKLENSRTSALFPTTALSTAATAHSSVVQRFPQVDVPAHASATAVLIKQTAARRAITTRATAVTASAPPSATARNNDTGGETRMPSTDMTNTTDLLHHDALRSRK